MPGEDLRRYFRMEEEFLDEYGDVAAVASKLLGDDWTPNYDCTDRDRHNHDHLLSTGEQIALVFESAAVFQVGKSFSSVQIVLRSSKHRVTVRVSEDENGELVAEETVDRPA